MAIDYESTGLDANSLVSQVIHSWRVGADDPDAREILRKHPILLEHRSLVLDLAYEEYCLRREAGERVVLSTYCDRFPTVGQSLRVLLATHECVEEEELENALPETVPWPKLKSLFLGFNLIQEIGRGAFARVYLATEPSLGDRLVVVKVSRRGESEAETLGRMTHRNIVPVYSIKEDEETQLTAICMPYLGRGTLLKVLDRAILERTTKPQTAARSARLFSDVGQEDVILNAIPQSYKDADPRLRGSFFEGAVHIMAQLADALAHAHAAGICHRDLKPSNILLAPSGCPLLLDFNLSSDERLQRTIVGGTLPYMPPEQLRTVLVTDAQEENLGDPRADIFSLGVIFYELLSGRLPFGDQDPKEDANVGAFRVMARQEEGATPLETLNTDCDSQLCEIVTKCLQLKPEDRYQSAEELAAVLHQRLTASARFRRWAHRRRFLLGATAASCGLLATAAGIGLARRPPYWQRKYQEGILAFETGEYSEAVSSFTDALCEQPEQHACLLARGQAYVKLAEYYLAGEDLRRAYKLAPDGGTAAWAGYAKQLDENNGFAAEYHYLRAIELHDYQTPAVWNNLGHVISDRSGRQAEAVQYLSKAIELDPRCQAAYLNRAKIYADYHEPVDPHGIPYSQHALDDAEIATTLEPNRGHAYFSLGMIHAVHNWTPEREKAIVECMRSALDHGYDREKLLTESGLMPAIIQALQDHPSGGPSEPAQALLIAPPCHLPSLASQSWHE